MLNNQRIMVQQTSKPSGISITVCEVENHRQIIELNGPWLPVRYVKLPEGRLEIVGYTVYIYIFKRKWSSEIFEYTGYTQMERAEVEKLNDQLKWLTHWLVNRLVLWLIITQKWVVVDPPRK